MDPAELARSVSELLTPLLPYLTEGARKVGAGVVEKITKKLGGELFNKTKNLLKKIRKQRQDIEDVCEDLAESPQGQEDALAAFRFGLGKLFKADPEIAAQAQEWLQSVGKETRQWIVEGGIHGSVVADKIGTVVSGAQKKVVVESKIGVRNIV